LPLDIQFVFTANPEDYTNRGSIVTPLKDRIDAQIITHYPKSIEIGKRITKQEARIKEAQKGMVTTNEIVHDLVEQVAIEARGSEFVDAKSGVSARLTISAFEQVVAGAERRALINGEKQTYVRVADFISAVPAVTGKVELVYEGEQEGAGIVAEKLMGKAIRTLFLNYFPDPDKAKKLKGRPSPYKTVQEWPHRRYSARRVQQGLLRRPRPGTWPTRYREGTAPQRGCGHYLLPDGIPAAWPLRVQPDFAQSSHGRRPVQGSALVHVHHAQLRRG
jgi:hypothetical protein